MYLDKLDKIKGTANENWNRPRTPFD
jgi:hypothetical protein